MTFVLGPQKVTVTFADNPLSGLPGQDDVLITISGDPELPLDEEGIEVKALESKAICAAVAAVAHVTSQALEVTLHQVLRGNNN